MTPRQALYYPTSYQKNLARGCAHYMTFLFARDPIPYTFEQHERWQDRLESFNIRIILAAGLDERVAIAALVLLERFREGGFPRPAYPHSDYFEYFFGAYWVAEQLLSATPLPNDFWVGVMGNVMVPEQRIKDMRMKITVGLRGDTSIPQERFLLIKGFLYNYVYIRTSARAGRWLGPTDPREMLERPPCWREMLKRKWEIEQSDDLEFVE